MCDCQTHKAGGVVVVLGAGCCGNGGRQTGKRKEIGPRKTAVEGRERKNIAVHIEKQ